MILKRSLIFVCLIALATSCGIQEEKRDLQQYQLHEERANRLLAEGDLGGAAEQYQFGLQIAHKMRWADGKVAMKQGLAHISSVQKRFEEAEFLLLEAESICDEEPPCSEGRLVTVWNNLMFLYLYQVKDINRATTVINRIISSKARPKSGGELRELLRKYAGWMSGAGFPGEAARLETEIARIGT